MYSASYGIAADWSNFCLPLIGYPFYGCWIICLLLLNVKPKIKKINIKDGTWLVPFFLSSGICFFIGGSVHSGINPIRIYRIDMLQIHHAVVTRSITSPQLISLRWLERLVYRLVSSIFYLYPNCFTTKRFLKHERRYEDTPCCMKAFYEIHGILRSWRSSSGFFSWQGCLPVRRAPTNSSRLHLERVNRRGIFPSNP